MMQKDFKVRMAVEVPEATSANVTAWIEELLASGGTLKPDPGAGPVTIALRLDSEKLVELANKKRERVAVILRRIIATKTNLPPAAEESEAKSAGAAAADLLPDKVLPLKLAYKPEDMLPIVRGMDKGLALAYRRIYGLKELDPAQTAEEDRDLAAAMAECANRRSPKWLIENADLAKLTFSLVRWTMAQTDELEYAAAKKKETKQPIQIVRDRGAEDKPIAEADQAEIEGVLNEPVQQEGQF